MKHFAVYWAWFKNKQEPWPVDLWRVGKGNPLTEVSKGDWLWLFASGRVCNGKFKLLGRGSGGFAEQLGYLLQILVVERVEPDDADMAFRIIGGEHSHRAVDPPILIDDWVRPNPLQKSQNIGTLRQMPHTLDQHAVDNLMKLLKQQAADVAEALGR